MKKEDLINFYKTYRLYIFPLMIVLSSLFLTIFVIYPQTVKLISNHNTSEDLANKSKFLESKVIALENYNSNDLSQQVRSVLGALPADKDYGNVLDLLQQLVAKSGFAISSISFGNVSSKLGNSDSIEVKLEVKGVKALFQTLLNNLDNSPRLVRVDSIDIASNQASQVFDVALSIRVLYASIPNDAGTVDSPLPELSQKEQELLTTLAAQSSVTTVIIPGEQPTSSSLRGKSNPFE